MEEIERMFLRLSENINQIYNRFDQIADILESLESRIQWLEEHQSW